MQSSLLALPILGLAVSCAGPTTTSTSRDASSQADGEESAGRKSDRERGAAHPASQGSGTSTGTGASAAPAGRVNLEDGRPPDPSHALPRVSTRAIGMHIGGESNAPDAKAPFLKALARQEVAYLLCYRLVEQPMKGGTFGADLYVSAKGGAPQVRAIRQRLGSDDFEQCMTSALQTVKFSPPPRPTMLSYSLRFDVEG